MLTGKLAVITGGASGIGRATARLFAREGALVLIVDTDARAGEDTEMSVREKGGEAVFFHADVGDDRDVKRLLEKLEHTYGRIDILHNNAAAYSTGRADTLSEADWDRTLDVSLKAAWNLSRLVAPMMLRQGGGAIVMTGSVHAIRGYAGHSAYQAAKGGLLALTRALAADYAPTIRVNTILPGAIETGLWSNMSSQDRVRIAQSCPLKRNGAPEDVANAALFFASDLSSFITAAVLVIDGGRTAIMATDDE